MSNVLVSNGNGICSITLNRPEKKNALTLAMYDDLTAALQSADADSAIRAILIAAAGDTFSAGNDLQDFLRQPPTDADSPALRFLATIATVRKPIVAGVTGRAIGIGTTLLLHCDLVYAAESATFHLPFVNLALCPEAASSYILPRQMGHARAAELLMLGEPFPADRALALGMITAVVPAGDVETRVRDAAARLVSKPPAALAATKALMKRHTGPGVLETIRAEGDVFMERLTSDEAREAMQAFLERRPADFSRFAAEG